MIPLDIAAVLNQNAGAVLVLDAAMVDAVVQATDAAVVGPITFAVKAAV